MSPQPPPPDRPSAPDQPDAPSKGAWPGPPSTWPGGPGGAAPPPDGRTRRPEVPGGPGGPGGLGGPGGPPPPPWRRRRRRWIWIASILGGLLIIGVPVGLGVAALSDFAEDLSLTSEGPATEGGGGGGADPTPREDVEVEVPDLDGLAGIDAELAAVLVEVDRAERTMMGAQDGFVAALDGIAGPGTQDDLDAALAEVSDVAGDGQRDLQSIRRDLADATASSGVVRDLRDRYLSHLDAWVRYLVAIEDEPTVLVSGADEGFNLAINTTGDAFADVIRDDLPDDLDEDVRAFAEAIVARGFPEGRSSAGDSV